MPPRFGNVAFSYRNRKRKWVFVPSERGREIGRKLKKLTGAAFRPDEFYFHLQKGGHVAALHLHRRQRYFARIDLENFFYGIGRNRVARALQHLGVARGEYYARWSTVRNPFMQPTYSVPYGFVQSPILASLVMSQCELGGELRSVASGISVSVYMDDIAISGNNCSALERAFRRIRRAAKESNFSINENKSAYPGNAIELFNCYLARMEAAVMDERMAEFYATQRSPRSEAAFEAYCAAVSAEEG